MSKRYRVVALPGEGIGPEIMNVALLVLDCAARLHHFSVQINWALIGPPALAACGNTLPQETVQLCRKSDGIVFGAVSQGGLLELRKQFDLFANLRLVRPSPFLFHCSPLKTEQLQSVDILFVRELVSGIYFGPSGRGMDSNGEYGYHTMQYYDWEIRRIAKVALRQAHYRQGLLTVAHKENALPHIPWSQLVAEEALMFPNVVVEYMLVDNLAMQLVMRPQHFDVILAGNLFGDILSDIGGALVGSVGLLGSASLNEDGFGLYEPIHGTAADLAGKGIANPLGMINSIVMMLQQWEEHAAANLILQAQDQLLSQGYRTADLWYQQAGSAEKLVTTQECVEYLIDAMENIFQSVWSRN
ncbi:3-isopropylmalate dehydrogenase [Leptolyngbya sp. NK1-12]|uniref:3-isopropylmalate dehydrogenase n=1 Tax=Leptolyngbya sp. NK1-12 TaxID=2547451 RepID=A0AA96WD81_9CYAN|nr:3-isopropylmalate dehydrogenase [Leptolyngbya sp. NK1-12]WNZ23029.1 3-isopropylmalate dehydrogenase [Leptolyngbya sp. NK1-12]